MVALRIVEIRGTYGCALATPLHPASARVGSPTKAQPLRASDLHNARATIINPYSNINNRQ